MAKFSLQKDPRVYARGMAKKPPDTKRALTLDLGTACGVAIADFVPGKPIKDCRTFLEQWDLSVGTHDSAALRHIRLKQFLSIVDPDIVGFEDVKVDVPVEQFRGKPLGMLVARIVPTAEFLGQLKNTVEVWCAERDIPYHGIPITVIKKNATGKGNANKVDMIKACNKAFETDFDPKDYESTGVDNIADAAFILRYLLEEYAEGMA